MTQTQNHDAPGSQQNPIDVLLSDPTLNKTSAEDPLLKFLRVWWRQVLVVLGGGLALFYVYVSFKETRLESMRHSADVFAKAREEFGTYLSAKRALEQAALGDAATKPKDVAGDKEKDKQSSDPEKAKKDFEEARVKFDKVLLALEDTDEPYSQIANVYRGLLSVYEGDSSKLTQALAPFSGWTSQVGSNRIIPEVGNLILARGLLENAATYEEGRNLLKRLASNGEYVHVVAASSLSRLASTNEERIEALQILQQVVTKYPEQLDLLREDLDRVKPSSK